MASKKYNLGENIVGEIVNDKLTITINMKHRGGLSKSGKTVRVASTEGNIAIPGTSIRIGLNAYVFANE